jgi:23S rRNA (pseudouridine1915-N3)-methyltransferase
MVWVPELRKSDPRSQAAQLAKEALTIRERVPANSFLVVLDQAGKSFTSEGFARFFGERLSRSTTGLTFVVGGHLGLSQRLIGEADLRLSLSEMTFPHELARVILLEQVYRGLSILKGLPYHR